MQLAELAPAPCCKHLGIDGPTVFVRHDGVISVQSSAKGEKPLYHRNTMLAQLRRNEGRHYDGPRAPAFGFARVCATSQRHGSFGDGEGCRFEIYVAPFQRDDFAAPEPTSDSEQDSRAVCAGDLVEKRRGCVQIERSGLGSLASWQSAAQRLHWMAGNQFQFDSALERCMEHLAK